MGIYRPHFYPQWNDPTTTYDWQDCTYAAGAMALDFHTLGKTVLRGGNLRQFGGRPTDGGSNLNDVAKAWAHYGSTLTNRTGHTFADLIADLKAGRGAIVQGVYGALPHTYHSPLNSLTFNGNHAVYLCPEFSATGDILMGDPLWDKFVWVPQTALKSFLEAFGRASAGASAPQHIYYAVTDAHPAPVVVAQPPVPVAPASYGLRIFGPTPVYDRIGGKQVGTAYLMSALATKTVSSGANWYHITSAKKFAGMWVRANGMFTASAA